MEQEENQHTNQHQNKSSSSNAENISATPDVASTMPPTFQFSSSEATMEKEGKDKPEEEKKDVKAFGLKTDVEGDLPPEEKRNRCQDFDSG